MTVYFRLHDFSCLKTDILCQHARISSFNLVSSLYLVLFYMISNIHIGLLFTELPNSIRIRRLDRLKFRAKH